MPVRCGDHQLWLRQRIARLDVVDDFGLWLKAILRRGIDNRDLPFCDCIGLANNDTSPIRRPSRFGAFFWIRRSFRDTFAIDDESLHRGLGFDYGEMLSRSARYEPDVTIEGMLLACAVGTNATVAGVLALLIDPEEIDIGIELVDELEAGFSSGA